jgi:signal transduction histidine kinase
LSSALKELLQSIETNSTISTKLQILGLENRLPIHQEIALYRIIQELISNTLKHANATQITVQIKRTKELVKLTVSDNGIGFEPKAITKGMGHDNLAIRVKQLDGEYSLNSQPNEGTTFICSFKEAKREEL